ncbi:MAG: response regulator [bacterium]|nr:response regulator [bacterium]
MRGNKKIIVLVLLLLVFLYEILCYLDFIESSFLLDIISIIFIIISGILLFFIIFIEKDIFSNDNRLFNSIIDNSDTIYSIINLKNEKVIYQSNNVKDILGIETSGMSQEQIYSYIKSIPIIKNEIDNWDKKDKYVSQMLKYSIPKYNYNIWIKLKLYNYNLKGEEYFILEVIDATKEHDKQHLLITQASDIKLRENTLNEITSKVYDFEININVLNNSYELEYFKKDRLYFGDEVRGIYTEGLKKILEYVKETDRENLYSILNLDSLREHFNKYELDSIVVRYRVGNEIKGNVWLESTVFFLTNKGRQNVSILTKNVTDDALAIREQNIILQNALNEAKKINKTKGELISTISHDIRIPLTSIVGLSDTLLSSNLGGEVREDVENIKSSSKDILKVIEKLLDPTKIDKEDIEKEEKRYSIYKMFKKIENLSKEYIKDRQIKLNIILDNNLPVVLYGDFRRITNAILELIYNAVNNTSEGSINVSVKGKKINDSVKLSVEVYDTGVGIAPDKLNKLLEEDGTTGLNSVKKIMEVLNGTLELESKVDSYTKATITYMQKIVEDNKVRQMIANNKSAEVFDLKGKKILVVDDNELNLKVTARLLTPYSVSTTLLQTGEECIDLINEGEVFDLIFMDQMMPVLDGTKTMEKLKQIDSFKTPIVVLTADAMNGQREKYLESGFDDYISKPIDKKELSRVLSKFLK